jgi:hypothetical protein
MDMRVRNELCAMGPEGDTKTFWDPDNRDEVAVARATFDSLKEKGFLIYHATAKGRGELMREFDPHAGKLVAVPRVVGG